MDGMSELPPNRPDTDRMAEGPRQTCQWAGCAQNCPESFKPPLEREERREWHPPHQSAIPALPKPDSTATAFTML